jgi:aminoglycoside phosphotransferase (APT) family kinase protein
VTQPWERADTVVDEAVVRRLLAAQFPTVELETLRLLNEGWGNRAFLVDEGGVPWIFRFPKIAGADRALAIEVALLGTLAPRLPLPIPRFDRVGRPDAGYPFGFVGYPLLRGKESHLVWGSFDPVATGTKLGEFFSALHAFPAEEAAALGVERAIWGLDLAEQSSSSGKYLAQIDPWLAPELRAKLDVVGSPPPAYQGPFRLVHADLAPDHLLIDAGAPSGVIDWGDVTLGDPTRDLAGAWYCLGPRGFDACLAAYAGPLDAGAMARIEFQLAFALCMDLAWAHATGRASILAAAMRILEA